MPDSEKFPPWLKAAVLYTLMLAYGVSTTFIGTVLVRLIDEFAIPVADGGIFYAVLNIGCFAGILVSGTLIERFRLRGLMTATYAAFACLMIGVSLTSTLAAYLALIWVIGVSSKLFDATVNATVARDYARNKGFYMNLLHCSYGVGSFLGPLVAGAFVEKGFSWRSPYLALGVLCLLLLAGYLLLFRRSPEPPPAASGGTRPAPFREVLNPGVAGLCALLVFYCGHQIGMNNWLPTYLATEFGTDTVAAGFGLSVFWLGLIVSRFSASFLTRRFHEKTLLIVGFAFGAAFLSAGVWADSEFAAFVAAGAAGFFTGATIPMALTLAYTWHPEAQGKVTMLLFIAITVGGTVFPWVMGPLGEYAGLKAAMYLNAGLLLIGFALALCIPSSGATHARAPEKEEHPHD